METKKAEIFQKIKLRWKEFETFEHDVHITLTKIGYQKYSELKLDSGTWQIFLLEKKSKTEFFPDQAGRIILIFAIWYSKFSDRKFFVSGMCEDFEKIINGLKYISNSILANELDDGRKGFRFSKNLTLENAQDYGYIRGLMAGIALMLIDILPWHIGTFRPQGILSTFLDYTRIVYFGTPGFAIVVGMAAIGVYFTVLFILIPILTGRFFMVKARKIEQLKISSMPEVLFDCEFGRDAEAFLNEQYRMMVENVKMEEVYKRISSKWKNVRKEDFYELYEIFRGGLITAESLYEVLQKINRSCPEFNFSECLRIMTDIMKRDTEVVLKVSDKQGTRYGNEDLQV